MRCLQSVGTSYSIKERSLEMKGRIHSIETFGAVDGPGIRTVFFMQGCPARCLYCHNPDSWKTDGGKDIEIEEIVHWAVRGIPYYGNKGGVTFSGGEPLMQGEFLIQAMEALKKEQINKVSLIAFTKNDIGNAFWNTIGWTKREDLNYYDFTLNEKNITAFIEDK